MSQPIILYDIASNAWAGQTWSPNVWKARIALNMKGVPYRTEWVELPDIRAHCTKLGLSTYTLPVIHDPSTSATVVDSFAIAKYLDATYPGGVTLVPEGSAAFQVMVLDVLYPTVRQPVMFLHVARMAASFCPRSKEYFRRTREAILGKPLEELAPVPMADTLWKKALEGLSRTHGWCNANGEGKTFFMGDAMSWADVGLVSMFAMIRTYSGPESEEWKQLMVADEGRWARMWHALEKCVHVDGVAIP